MIAKKNIQNLYPLSPLQEGMLFHALYDEKSQAYFEQVNYRHTGPFDAELFEHAFNRLIERHDILRTAFVHENATRPLQIVLKQRPIKLHQEDWQQHNAKEQETKIKTFVAKDREHGFQLQKDPLLRIAALQLATQVWQIVISYHHIIMDGWSLALLFEELNKIQEAKAKEQTVSLTPAVPYSRYIKWLEKQDHLISKQFWEQYLSGFEETTNLPAKSGVAERQGFVYGEVILDLEENLSTAIDGLANEYNTTVNNVVQGLWALLLAGYNDCTDVIFGTTVSGRPPVIPGIESMIGMCINTIPVRVQQQEGQTFAQLLQKIHQSNLAVSEHQYFSLADIQSTGGLGHSLFNHILVFENYPFKDQLDDGQSTVTIDHVEAFEQTNFDFSVTINPGPRMRFRFSYNQLVFDPDQVKRLGCHLEHLATQVTRQPEQLLKKLSIATQEEQQQILQEFNHPKSPYPESATLVSILKQQVQLTPDNIAVVYQDQTLTYEELDVKTDQLATFLVSQGVQKDAPIGIMALRSMEMIVGIFGILKAGGAYLPLDPKLPEERLRYMLEDSKCQVLLAGSWDLKEKLALESISVFDLQNQVLYKGHQTVLPVIDPRQLAYIIYTSGSTGRPKGVMVEHTSVVNRIHWMQQAYPISVDDVIIQKTPFTFDVSVWELFWWSFVGGKMCFLEPEGEKEPLKIIQAIRQYQVSVMHFVPSMLSLFLDQLEEEPAYNALQSLKLVFASGEALPLRQVQRFNHHLYKANQTELINLYGPTEATVDVSYFNCSPWSGSEVVPIGRPIQNVQLYVLNKRNQLLPPGVTGELCIAGVGVARGYLHKPELTAEKFTLSPFNPEEVLYHTGDSARWMPDGNIEYIGRMDFQVKLRGLRIELGEIEYHLQQQPEVNEVTVIVKTDPQGDQYLCAYIVGKQTHTDEKLKQVLLQFLPEYMVPMYFVYLEQFPLSPNGKLDRKKLPDPDNLAQVLRTAYQAPRNDLEKQLATIWCAVLNKEQVGIYDNFFQLGGHSLKATRLISRIQKELKVAIPLKQIFQSPTIEQLAGYMVTHAKTSLYEAIVPVPISEWYEMSSAQKRLFSLDQIHGANTSYNIPAAILIKGNIQIAQFEESLNQLIQRHETLRTGFEMLTEEAKPVQKVYDEVDFELDFEQAAGAGSPEVLETFVKEALAQFVRPFNLSRPPLLRMKLVQLSVEQHILLADIHHIISDGTSSLVLLQDLMQLYQRVSLEPLTIQYKDFSTWQNRLFETGGIKNQESYWRKRFSGDIPTLELPTDFPRPAEPNFQGDTLHVELDIDLSRQLKQFAEKSEATLYMVLLAAYNVLLSKYSGQHDIIIGAPIAGRPHEDLQPLIGMFVNTLAMRNQPSSEKTFKTFLNEVKVHALEAYENQDYQFEHLVDHLNLTRDLSRQPLFDTLFVLQNMGNTETTLQDISFSFFNTDSNSSKFDLSLFAYEQSDGMIELGMEYATALFKAETIQRWMMSFEQILRTVIAQPELTITELQVSIPSDRKRIKLFNATEVPYDYGNTIAHRIEHRMQQHPEAIAVTMGSEQWTYKELQSKVYKLASLLQQNGVTHNTIVAVIADRSVEMVTALLAVVHAGGAYLPIDPDFPTERMEYMLTDSGTQLLLTQKKLQKTLQYSGATIWLDDERIYHGNISVVEPISQPEDLFYVMYTSGSTGHPKGVMLEHRNLLNLALFEFDQVKINYSGKVLQFSTISFDVSFHEIFCTLMQGGTVCLVDKETRADFNLLFNFIEQQGIDNLFIPTAMMKTIMHEESLLRQLPICVKNISSAGEQLLVNDALRELIQAREIHFYNYYGPSETHVVTYYEMGAEVYIPSVPPIGKPVANTKVYLLDQQKQPVPFGAYGEAYISGANVGRGYLNKVELSADRFLHDPWNAGQRMYRTGDLARWLPDGNLDFGGRVDHQVKIRGYRVEPGEIETQLLTVSEIKEVAVVDKVDQQGLRYLVAYVVSVQSINVETIKKDLGYILPDYMIPSYFIQLEHLPYTPNGKVDRKALPDPDTGLVDGVADLSDDMMEQKLGEVWQQVLKVDQIHPNSNFFDLGGHSLKAAALSLKIERILKLPFPVKEIFRYSTLREQAAFLKESSGKEITQISALAEQPYYELSHAQKRLWIIHQMEGGSAAYNMTSAHEIKGTLDVEKLKQAFQQIVMRHESLRTTFTTVEEEPRQVVHASVNTVLQSIDISHEQDSQIKAAQIAQKQANQVFDLVNGPLIEATVVYLGEQRYWVVLTLHHIITDGWSMEHLMTDMVSLYHELAYQEEANLKPLRIQYKDFAAWQNQQLSGEAYDKLLGYWNDRLSGDLPLLKMPLDYERNETADQRGQTLNFFFETELKEQLEQLGKKNRATLYHTLMAAYNVLLWQLSEQETILVGTSVAGREHPDLESVIGFFVNTLPVKTKLKSEMTFEQLLQETAQHMVEDMSHQQMPFDLLIQELGVKRIAGYSPLFQVRFVYNDFFTEGADSSSPLEVTEQNIEVNYAKFDLSLTMQPHKGGLGANVEYRTDLFKPSTIERFMAHFKQLLQDLIAHESQPLSALTPYQQADKQLAQQQAQDKQQAKRAMLQKLKLPPLKTSGHGKKG